MFVCRGHSIVINSATQRHRLRRKQRASGMVSMHATSVVLIAKGSVCFRQHTFCEKCCEQTRGAGGGCLSNARAVRQFAHTAWAGQLDGLKNSTVAIRLQYGCDTVATRLRCDAVRLPCDTVAVRYGAVRLRLQFGTVIARLRHG